MPKDAILAALDNPANQAINTMLGPVLKPRLDQESWADIIILQHLDRASPNLASWNNLFERVFAALADRTTLIEKAHKILSGVATARFNDALDDLIAEMLAAIYLVNSGHTAISFMPEGGPITADIESQFQDARCYTEVKNLRDPRSLSIVAFKRWHRNIITDPEKFAFQADLLDLDDPLVDLTADQEAGLIKLVDDLPNRPIPSEFVYSLPGARQVRVRLANGAPVMLRHGGGPFLVGPVVDRAKRSLLLKLLEPTRKAVAQLYQQEIPEEAKHLMFVRWKVPEDIGAIEEIDSVRTSVYEQVKQLLHAFFPNFALVIAHTHQDPRDVPQAEWN